MQSGCKIDRLASNTFTIFKEYCFTTHMNGKPLPFLPEAVVERVQDMLPTPSAERGEDVGDASAMRSPSP